MILNIPLAGISSSLYRSRQDILPDLNRSRCTQTFRSSHRCPILRYERSFWSRGVSSGAPSPWYLSVSWGLTLPEINVRLQLSQLETDFIVKDEENWGQVCKFLGFNSFVLVCWSMVGRLQKTEDQQEQRTSTRSLSLYGIWLSSLWGNYPLLSSEQCCSVAQVCVKYYYFIVCRITLLSD